MDRAERADHLQRMDEEAGHGDKGHQQDPDIAQDPVISGAFRSPQLERAENRRKLLIKNREEKKEDLGNY